MKGREKMCKLILKLMTKGFTYAQMSEILDLTQQQVYAFVQLAIDNRAKLIEKQTRPFIRFHGAKIGSKTQSYFEGDEMNIGLFPTYTPEEIMDDAKACNYFPI